MNLRLLVFAEYAAIGQDGKLVIAGITDGLMVNRGPNVPTDGPSRILVPKTYLVAIIEASLADGLTHALALRLIDGNGQALPELVEIGQHNFTINKFGRPMQLRLVVEMNGLQLPGPDDYVFQLVVDGEEVGEAPYYVTDVTPAP